MSNAVAVSIVPGELRLLVARANGAMEPLHQLSGELPEGVVRAGLRPPNVTEPDTATAVLRRLAGEAAAARQGSGLVALLVPDAAVRMAFVRLEGAEPSRDEGNAMASWALGDVLPVENGGARVDWAAMAEAGAETTPAWLLAVGADAAVLDEYEAVVRASGWAPGRVVPMTLALAVGTRDIVADSSPGAARLVVSGIGGQVACLLEANGVPRLHRAWRGAAPDLESELVTIQRYADSRLGLTIVDAVIAGPESWREGALAAARARGWKAHACSGWAALIGAVQA